MLGVENQRGVHGAFPQRARLAAMQQVQEMRADGIVVGFYLNALAVGRIVIPIEQHGTEGGHQAVGHIARAGDVVVILFRQGAAQGRDAGAHDIHRMRRSGQRFQRLFDAGGQTAHGFQLGLVGAQLRASGQFAVHQQIGDFLKLAMFGDVENVIAAIAQVVARLADGTQRSVARRDAREGDGFFHFRRFRGVVFRQHAHGDGFLRFQDIFLHCAHGAFLLNWNR